jgi:prolyl 4-hydroxylase
MRHDCPATCLLCGNITTKSTSSSSSDANAANNKSTMCPPRPQVMNIYSEMPQTIAHSDNVENIHDYMRRVDDYMYDEVYDAEKFSLQDRIACKNKNEHCTHWAARGECHVNPEYMKLDCAPACFSCHELQYRHRCMLPNPTSESEDAWTQPGELNQMFQRIVDNPEYASQVTILSRPLQLEITTTAKVPDGPWVLYIDDFLTMEECESMMQLGKQRGYTRSIDQTADVNTAGNLKAGVSQHRTSSTAWCLDDCARHNVTQSILQKMERLTHISQMHAEYLQLLRYNVGQSYGHHHDYTSDDLLRRQGPRILTIFIYLNNVEAGGGTHFSLLNLVCALVCCRLFMFVILNVEVDISRILMHILFLSLCLLLQTVTPKQGRVVLWPSVLDDAPKHVDSRTAHEALVVEQGVKYGT